MRHTVLVVHGEGIPADPRGSQGEREEHEMMQRSATGSAEEGIEKIRGREPSREPEAAREGEDPPVVLVATDGSEVSLRAGEHAARLARTLGARLVALYVVDEDAAFHAGIHYGDAVAELVRAGHQATAKVASLAAEVGIECRQAVVSGKPHRAIVSVANDLAARYIVLGTHGGSAFERVVLGSVSAKVLHLAERPVMVIGGDAPRFAPRRADIPARE